MVATNSSTGTNTRIKVLNSASQYYAELAADSASLASTAATNAGNSETACLNYKNATYQYMERTETAAATVQDIIDHMDNINAVADDLENINAVAGDLTNIDAVIDNISDIEAVNDNKTNIDAVAGNATNINAVNANKTNIDTVAGMSSNISSILSDMTNINAVASDLTNIDNASANAALSKDWANKMDGTVDGTEYSAKYYAQQASQGQVQSNWAESDTTAKSYIQNKPDLTKKQNVLTAGENIKFSPIVDYIQNAANTKINTGVEITQDDFELDITFYCNSTTSLYLFQIRDDSSSKITGIAGSGTGGTITLNCDTKTLASDITRTIGHIYHVNGRFNNGSMTLKVDDLTEGTTDTKTDSYTYAQTTTPLYIFGNNSTQTLAVGHRVYNAYCKINGQYGMNYIPALDNNSTPCFYDTVSKEYKYATAGSFVAGDDTGFSIIDAYNIPTDTSDLTNGAGFITTSALTPYQLIEQSINVLSTSGTIALTDNSVNTITPTGNVTFTLPTVTDNTVLHQIFVQVNLSTVYSFDLGLGATPHYFNKTAPDMSNAGVYNLIFEYDKANQYWVGGCIAKGAAS